VLDTLEQNKAVEKEKQKLAWRVNRTRQDMGISLRALSEKTGVSYRVIYKIEHCRPVKFDSLLKVLWFLDISIKYVDTPLFDDPLNL